jgi:hypothetical protein
MMRVGPDRDPLFFIWLGRDERETMDETNLPREGAADEPRLVTEIGLPARIAAVA